MKKPLRDPKIDREWRTTFILASVAALLSLAVVVVAAMHNFWYLMVLGRAARKATVGL